MFKLNLFNVAIATTGRLSLRWLPTVSWKVGEMQIFAFSRRSLGYLGKKTETGEGSLRTRISSVGMFCLFFFWSASRVSFGITSRKNYFTFGSWPFHLFVLPHSPLFVWTVKSSVWFLCFLSRLFPSFPCMLINALWSVYTVTGLPETYRWKYLQPQTTAKASRSVWL